MIVQLLLLPLIVFGFSQAAYFSLPANIGSGVDANRSLCDDSKKNPLQKHLKEFKEHGFTFVEDPELMRIANETAYRDFLDEYDQLTGDPYQQASVRSREYGILIYDALTNSFAKLDSLEHTQYTPHEDHYPIRGGTRRFRPFRDSCMPFLEAHLRKVTSFFIHLPKNLLTRFWYIKVHLFLVPVEATGAANSAVEGIHTDGNDYTSVSLIQRHNVQGGDFIIYDRLDHLQGQKAETTVEGLVKRVPLRLPLHMAILDDKKFFHGVSDFRSLDGVHRGKRSTVIYEIAKVHEKVCRLSPTADLVPSSQPPNDSLRSISQKQLWKELSSDPLVITEPHSLIIEGHQKWAEAKTLGLPVVPVVQVPFESLFLYRNRFSPDYSKDFDSLSKDDYLKAVFSKRFYPWDTIYLHSLIDKIKSSCPVKMPVTA